MASRASVVIPVHGRAALTKRCLDAVLATVAATTEVVVVDDASTDETAALLASYGEAVNVVSLERNAGFATASNRGAEAAAGEWLVFLNNDTEPRANWLAALLAYAAANPAADVVGAKLVYPTGAVQHAGVVFGQDGYPHNLYAGLPADHPAVNRSRPLQAVTAACALFRRAAFEQAGGFDSGYENSLEDVDLCLRIGKQGGEVHYCHEAEVVHLESASRGRSDRFEASVSLYRERWRETVHRDDLEVYVADGLLAVEYPDAYPLRTSVSPLLSVVDRGREEEIERLLEGYAAQVSDLLQEVVRLTASTPAAPAEDGASVGAAGKSPAAPDAAADPASFLARARRIEAEVHELQLAAEGLGSGFIAGSRLGYRESVERLRLAVAESVPAGATVLVISRGDREAIRFDGRTGKHFPQAEDGGYLGHYPASSGEAIEQLEALRAGGARFLVVPPTATWWLDHYEGFAAHLSRYPTLDCDACVIYRLDVEP